MSNIARHLTPRSAARPDTGAALVLTLGMLVLLSGLVLALLLTVRTEYGSAKAYEGGTNARLLADSALNLVIGQIREASTQPDKAWISQPGLMRTFDTSGKVVKCYKLYSADSLVEDDTFDPAKATDLPGVFPTTDARNWKKQPGLWTDINAPVADLTRTDPFDSTKKLMIYPIFDGNHINSSGQLSLNKTTADIEGFTVDNYATNQVTMPVKWLYLLKDGTLAPAKRSGTAGDVEVLVPVGKDKTAQGEINSVVGRVAFWTDDETAKVNINTASEGTFWDTPVSNGQPGIANAGTTGGYVPVSDSTFEWELAAWQGAQKEYQRYPGHPATTCLSPIFGSQLLKLVGTDRKLMAEEIFKFIPRVTGAQYAPSDPTYSGSPTPTDNSSKAGTARAGSGSGDTSEKIVTPDGDRLYASIDEFLFNPNFGSPTAPSTRTAWKLAPPVAARDTTREMLEMAKFFLTASSKAPEQNLYNQPRIAIWPEQVLDAKRTAFDKLIAFCSTVGPKTGTTQPFYFTREYGDSATKDLSPRNLELMAYLQGLTGRAVPGWDTTGAAAKTFAAKYSGGDCNQILTEIFDYIRCTNLADNSAAGVDSSYTQIVETPPIDPSGKSPMFLPDSQHSTHGQVIPIEMPDGTRGMGRIMTISELALIATRKPDTDLPAADQATKAKIQVALVPKFFCPMAGYSALANDIRVTFNPIEITVQANDGTPVTPFKDSKQPTLYDIGHMHDSDAWHSSFGGSIGWAVLSNMPTNLRNGRPDSAPPTGEMVVNKASKTLVIEGTVTAIITAPAQANPTNTTNEPIVQTIKFKFPKFTVPVPLPTTAPATYEYIVEGGTGSSKCGMRYYNGTTHYLLTDKDAVRSLVATGNNNLQGDMRLIAARKNINDQLPASDAEYYFQPTNRTAYDNSALLNKGQTDATKATHSMRQGLPHRGSEPGSAFGLLVNAMTGYNPGIMDPDLPVGINGVVNSMGKPGDWDTGPFILRDGPYCNKADEGTKPKSTDITPYIGNDASHQDYQLQGTTFFSPNRQIPSAVMFGSLPTGVKQNKPWQTLLFRPAKYYLPGGDGSSNNGISHPGSAKYGPPDHLLLDLFWMPVVEPYAISEPFATAGKINLNQQIAPFTNIRRDTGLRAVLKSVKITAMNPNQTVSNGNQPYIYNYKSMSTAGRPLGDDGAWGVISRRSIDLDNTLRQISDRLDRNKPFVSASEICDIPLIPQDVPPVASLPSPMKNHVKVGIDSSTSLASFDSQLATFWGLHKLTGDNALEKPYAYIYPRLTTRSNSYTVHVRVQTLAQNSRNTSFILKAAQSQPTGEFRGSFLIERYLDANSAGFVDSNGNPVPNPGANTAGLALGPYRFRVVSSKQFVP